MKNRAFKIYDKYFANKKLQVTRIFLVIILIYATYNCNEQLTFNYSYNESGEKYVQFECNGHCGGWSDRLDGILSAMALALIQNRTFLIFINQPCLLTDLFEPNSIEWNRSIPNENKLSVYRINSIDNFAIQNQMSTLNLKNYLSNYDIIKIKNNQDWLKAMSENTNVKERIKMLGYQSEKFRSNFVFKEWYNKLFKLNNKLETEYKKFLKRAKPTIGTKLICLQIRLGGSNRKKHSNDFKFNDPNVTKTIWKYVKNNFLNNTENNFKIFITTDDELVQKEAFVEFGKDKVVTNEGEILHIDRDVERLNDCSRIEKTILDFHSLQNCETAIVTSGFGEMGVWNRNDPIKDLFLVSQGKIEKKT